MSQKSVKSEPAPVSLSPFDALGKVRDLSGAADVALIEAMPDSQRGILFKMLGDAKAAEEVELRIAELRTAIAKAMHEQTRASEANTASIKPPTQQELMAAVRHAHEPDMFPAPEKRRPVNPKFASDLAIADAELIRLRDEFAQANRDIKALSLTRGASIGAFLKTMPVITDESVRRDYLQKSGEQRLALAQNPPPAAPAPIYPIEASYRERGSAPKKRPFVGSNVAARPLGHKY
jgi:hypothetical protein